MGILLLLRKNLFGRLLLHIYYPAVLVLSLTQFQLGENADLLAADDTWTRKRFIGVNVPHSTYHLTSANFGQPTVFNRPASYYCIRGHHFMSEIVKYSTFP